MKILNIHIGQWGKIRAFFDVETSEGFVMKGFKLIDSDEGMFVGFPSQKKEDGTYKSTIWTGNAELKNEVNELAHQEFRNPRQGDVESKPKKDDDIPF